MCSQVNRRALCTPARGLRDSPVVVIPGLGSEGGIQSKLGEFLNDGCVIYQRETSFSEFCKGAGLRGSALFEDVVNATLCSRLLLVVQSADVLFFTGSEDSSGFARTLPEGVL